MIQAALEFRPRWSSDGAMPLLGGKMKRAKGERA